MEKKRREEIARRLVEWYKEKGRMFPWRMKGLRPYEILIAEMMLQRTRAEMVMKAYSGFLRRYPDPQSLAIESIENIALALKPLGLYKRRAKWMKTAAEMLLKKYDGKVPDEPAALAELPGLGMYNVNAILCFAYNKPVPLIDINVARVLGRVASIDVQGDLRKNKNLHNLAAKLVPETGFKEFNWALVDMGAIICTPKDPKHDECPIAHVCNFVLQQKTQKDARAMFIGGRGSS